MPPHHTDACREQPCTSILEEVSVEENAVDLPNKSTPKLSLKEKIFQKLHEDETEDHHEHGVHKSDIIRIVLVAVGVLASITNVWKYLPNVPFDIIGLITVVLGGYPIYKEAFMEGIMQLKMTMELSMTIALVSALAIKEFETAAIIVLFVLIAEVLEHLTVGQGRKALKKLTDILPNECFIIDPQTKAIKQVDIANLQVGDIVMIKPGGRIPVDGKVT
jgi:Cd2+/Zn2+-exporting ATPase/Cu+-exporting ATPase